MTERKSEIYEVDLARWAELVGLGTQNAVVGLSEMVGMKVQITALDLKVVPVVKAADLVGGPENEVVVIYLAISGGATGHIMLVYPKPIAFGLVDILIGNPVGTTADLGDLEASALAEMGNITGSFFLNSMADHTGMRLMPSTPSVMIDMAGSILDAAIADIMIERDELFAMETLFATENREISGTLLVLPTEDFMDIMLEQSKLYESIK